VRYAFHQVAVGGQHIGVMIDDWESFPVKPGCQQSLGQRHADRIAEALPQRPGGRFDAARRIVFRVTGRDARPLPEALDFLERHIIPVQVKQCVKQGRAVPSGEHESIAVGPGWIGRVVLQIAGPQHKCKIGGAQRQPGVA
jgi:hypothetical protein